MANYYYYTQKGNDQYLEISMSNKKHANIIKQFLNTHIKSESVLITHAIDFNDDEFWDKNTWTTPHFFVKIKNPSAQFQEEFSLYALTCLEMGYRYGPSYWVLRTLFKGLSSNR